MNISIVIITYNHERYLEQCLLSCLRQNKTNLKYEIIVVDDGSTDNTPKIFQKFDNENIRLFRIENSGIEKAANFGFQQATGNHIARVDADDLLMLDYLQTMERFIEEKSAFFYPNYIEIDEVGKALKKVLLPEFDANEILNRGDFLASGTLIRADVLNSFGGYQENVVNSGLENYEFIIDVILSGLQGTNIPAILFKYRRHGQNLSTLKRDQIIDYGRELFARKNLGRFSTNIYHPYDLRI